MIRELVLKMTGTLTQRRASARKCLQVPVKISFEPNKQFLNFRSPNDGLFLSGETVDLSKSGIGVLVSSIRIKEDYLVGQERLLNVELDLAGRKVQMQVIGRRYERVGIHLSTEKYLIGAEIVNMAEDHQRTYEYFLQNGSKLIKSVPAGLGAEA
jgi:c-di-GMP-binding flagellar brake protein YcgR